MANYTVSNATEDFFNYIGLNREEVESVPNTNNRGFIISDNNDCKCVVFLYPVSCKNDDSKRFFDTRDSGPVHRALAWKYASDNNLKYFCIGVHSQNYKDYLLSLESLEERISQVSGLENGQRRGKSGTQVVIPKSFHPQKPFERIKTQYGFFISFIKKELFFDYITVFDNRPYNPNPDDNPNNEIRSEFVHFSDNILLYGVPGCGKSYYVEQNYENQISKAECKVRVVFHPDYTYTDFIGQLTPYVAHEDEDDEKLRYDFIPGPFTRILQVAEANKTEKCLLIIEELNRGNAPAIFGEIFQLLDREDDGSSKYAIYNREIADEVYGDKKHPIKLPPNLSILATMNTADQNVFTMDTAFQRRWQMKHIPNKFAGPNLDQKTREQVATTIPGSTISWGIFATTVNKEIGKAFKGFAGSEDKRLGVYFANGKDLQDKERFAEKVLKYLWDDAFKMDREKLFNNKYDSLTDIIETFEEANGDGLKQVLNDDVYKGMLKKAEEEAKPKAAEVATAPEVEAESTETTPALEAEPKSEGAASEQNNEPPSVEETGNNAQSNGEAPEAMDLFQNA